MCVPAPACKQALNEASRLWPNRRRTSDGICSSPTHQQQSPNSDHDYGEAFDLSDDPVNGCDAHHLAELLIRARDPRVKYVISNARIWNASKDRPGVWRPYFGSNAHTLHVHVSINRSARDSTAAWWTPLLKPLTPREEPFMALTDAEQKQLLEWAGRSHHELVAEQQSVREFVAQSAYRTAVLEKKQAEDRALLDRIVKKLGA